MNFVEPIRDRKKIAQIKNQLRGQRRYRDLLLFVVGMETKDESPLLARLSFRFSYTAIGISPLPQR
ncbi:hypothetical protein ACFLYP_00680 [Chloroflexota bacterium]